MVDIWRTPLLTARETARHLQMPETTLDGWLRDPADGGPLVHGVVPEKRAAPRVPFVGIVEAYVLRSLRDLGTPLAEVRAAALLVRREFDDPYALASKRIATDGVNAFVRLLDESVVRAVDAQQGIREVLDGYLEHVEWDDRDRPLRIRLQQYPKQAAVVIDPRFGWGAPVLSHGKVPVDAMTQLWRAGESMQVIAHEFDLEPDVVEDVLRVAA